jgi:hypothetical protein
MEYSDTMMEVVAKVLSCNEDLITILECNEVDTYESRARWNATHRGPQQYLYSSTRCATCTKSVAPHQSESERPDLLTVLYTSGSHS